MSATPKTEQGKKVARAIEMAANPGQLFYDLDICAGAMDQIGRRGTAALVRLAALQVKHSVMDEADIANTCLTLLDPIIKKTAEAREPDPDAAP